MWAPLVVPLVSIVLVVPFQSSNIPKVVVAAVVVVVVVVRNKLAVVEMHSAAVERRDRSVPAVAAAAEDAVVGLQRDELSGKPGRVKFVPLTLLGSLLLLLVLLLRVLLLHLLSNCLSRAE